MAKSFPETEVKNAAVGSVVASACAPGQAMPYQQFCESDDGTVHHSSSQLRIYRMLHTRRMYLIKITFERSMHAVSC